MYLANQTPSSPNIYRGQQLLVAEVETLKNAEGSLIAMNSFISATKKYDVAAKFARRSVGQAGLKPVIFEICIDRYDGEHDQQLFADITGESWYGEDEAEILLCMRTVMHIESVNIEEPTARIRLRLCRYDDVANQNCDADLPLLMYNSSNLFDEQMALFKMLITLISTGEYHRAQQVLNIMQGSGDFSGSNLVDYFAALIKMVQGDITGSNVLDRVERISNQKREFYQAVLNLKSVPDVFRTVVIEALARMDDFQRLEGSENMNELNVPTLVGQLNDVMKSMREFITNPKTLRVEASLDDILGNMHFDFLSEKEPSSQQTSTADLERFESNKDAELPEKHPTRILLLSHMALIATDNGEYDQAIKLIRNGLSIPCPNDYRVLLYQQLATIHKKQGNWLETIKSHQQIINMLQLPPNSSAIIEAHVQCGDEYSEIKEFSQAYNCYAKALDLQLQHYPHDHLQTSKIYIKIGDCYGKLGNVTSALENYQKAISTGHPETASDAYRCIAQIYMVRKEYDSARSNLIKSLDLAKVQQPQHTTSLVYTYEWLIIVEHRNNHHHQRDIYIDQLMKLTDSREKVQSFMAKEIEWVLNFVNTTNT